MASQIMSNKTDTAKSLLVINKQIRNISNNIEKLDADRITLANLVKDFKDLVFDKLALNCTVVGAKDNTEQDFQILRVLLGRIKASSKFFGPEEVPLSVKGYQTVTNKSSFFTLMVYLSRDSATKRLHELATAYVQLRTQCSGLTETIKRFEEDNAALRQEIHLQQHGADSEKLDIWRKLANVDLLTSNRALTAAEASSRRLSALSQRRMSFTSIRPSSSSICGNTCAPVPGAPSDGQHNEYQSNLVANSFPIDARQRSIRCRSGAFYNDIENVDTSWGSTNTSYSSISQHSIVPKRYSTYDSTGRKICT